jgi:hypothetical protein
MRIGFENPLHEVADVRLLEEVIDAELDHVGFACRVQQIGLGQLSRHRSHGNAQQGGAF